MGLWLGLNNYVNDSLVVIDDCAAIYKRECHEASSYSRFKWFNSKLILEVCGWFHLESRPLSLQDYNRERA